MKDETVRGHGGVGGGACWVAKTVPVQEISKRVSRINLAMLIISCEARVNE